MSFKRILYVMVLILPFLSCKKSSDSKASSDAPKDEEQSAAQKNIAIFNKMKDLPTCDTKSEQQTVYVNDEKGIYTCTAKKWVRVELTPTTQVVIEQSITDRWRKVWESAAKSVAYIEGKYENSTCTQYESGSGFVVGDGVVATNGHVVAATTTASGCGTMKLTQLRLWFPEGTQGDTRHTKRGSDGTVTKIDRSIARTDDIALLQVPTNGRAALKLSSLNIAADRLNGDGVKLGDEILQMGYSSGTTFLHFVTGRINAIQLSESNAGSGFMASLVLDGLISAGKTILEYDVVSGAGASGGPVLNLAGDIIGINFAGNTKDADTEFGYGLIVQPLRELIPKARVWEALSP